MHEKEYVHADIKSSNIMLGFAKTAKLKVLFVWALLFNLLLYNTELYIFRNSKYTLSIFPVVKDLTFIGTAGVRPKNQKFQLNWVSVIIFQNH